MSGSAVEITAAVEGIVDEAAALRLIQDVGARSGPVYGKNGKPFLRKQLGGYNYAARYSPWMVLVDLDQDADCAPPFKTDWLRQPARWLCFRVAVRAVEAWFLADHEHLSNFLGVLRKRLPKDPDALENPKVALIDLARQSRKRTIRDGMAPRSGSGRKVGPVYSSLMIEFAQSLWSPSEAAQRSESLHRAIQCLRSLVTSAKTNQNTP